MMVDYLVNIKILYLKVALILIFYELLVLFVSLDLYWTYSAALSATSGNCGTCGGHRGGLCHWYGELNLLLSSALLSKRFVEYIFLHEALHSAQFILLVFDFRTHAFGPIF